jgi:hypothetical protein
MMKFCKNGENIVKKLKELIDSQPINKNIVNN